MRTVIGAISVIELEDPILPTDLLFLCPNANNSLEKGQSFITICYYNYYYNYGCFYYNYCCYCCYTTKINVVLVMDSTQNSLDLRAMNSTWQVLFSSVALILTQRKESISTLYPLPAICTPSGSPQSRKLVPIVIFLSHH